MTDLLTGFGCVADSRAEILILGSMPGVASLEQQQYYAHPRNVFWNIMQDLYGIDRGLPYSQRLNAIQQHGIALWDVVHRCQRDGSLDSNIRTDSVQVNDFEGLFSQSPNINRVCFNGGKAAQLFRQWQKKQSFSLPNQLEFLQLPSTSPAHAALSFEQKRDQWALALGLKE